MKNITQASCCLLLSLLLWMGTGTAKPVDTLNAKTAATHFLMGRTGGNAKSARQVHIVYTGQALDESSQRTVPCYYIINMNQGFVIISADDRIEPILGYSTEGNFNAEDIPDNLRAFLNGYSTQIKEYLHDAPDCPNEASAKWASLMREDYTQNATKGAVIGPLLETTWDQNSPYNVLCPADANGPGGYVYAGCVATAMAQVIRYWEYPSTGAGNKSYICNFSSSSGGEYGDYGTLSAYFGYSSYNYANMPASISTSSPTSQISEIAKLIYHCGVSVEMMYGADGSGASVSDAPYALQHYFKYSSNYGTLTPQYKSINSYTGNWISLLKSELDQWRPVIYRGQGTGGHAFVCDGYDDQNYFHFNWGWSGSYNGYYILTDLTPGPYTFNSSQGMVINIEGKTPLIKTDQTSLSFLCESNTISEAKHIAIHGVALSSNITITAPANFQISLDGTNFSSSLNVSNSTSGIYVRYVPTAAGTTTDYGALTLTSGSVTKTVALTGRTYALDCNPPQNVQYTSDNNGNVQLSWNAPTQDIHSYRFSIDSTTTNSIWGLGASNYLLAQRACDSDLVAYHQKIVTQVSFYIPYYVVANSSDRKIVIYQGGSFINNTLNEGTLIREQSVSSFSYGWNTVTLTNPVTIDAHKELWYGVQFNTTYSHPVPVGTNSGVTGKGDLVKKDGSWTLLSSYSNSNIHRNLPLKITIQDSPSSITNYTIQRNNSIVGTSTSTQYNDHVTSSGNYTYNVTANWDNGCSATSEDITMDIITDCTTTYGDTTAVECVSFTWYDSTYTVSTETATHTFVGGNANGCDSIVTLHLTINPTYYFPENHTVNQGSLPFNWHGKTFNTSATAYDSLTTTVGCDSVYFLTLTVTPFNIIEDTPIALCQGETANWRGHILSEQGAYRDTVLAENTIHTVVVTVNPTYFFPENVTVTQGSLPFNWHGKTFNASATAYDSLTTTAGCDSVYFLTLTVTPFNIVQDGPIALCQGETANWRGHLVAEQGTYSDTALAENNIYTVDVTVNPTYYFPENHTVNQGSLPYNWHGKTFNASATAYDSLTTTAGCDSVYFLNLTVTAFNIIEDDPIALCQGETANWRGHLVAEQGTYSDTALAENNIYTVDVTVNPTYYFPENRTVTQGSLPFHWHGKTFNASTTAYDSLTTTAGCDSIFFLTLTVTAFNIVQDNPIALCQGETANWRGHLLTEQGTYRDTALAENNIHTVVVTVNPTYFFPENHTVTQGSLPFNWHGKTFNASATAYDSLTTTAGCDSVYFLNLTVTAFNIIEDNPIALCQGETANWRGHLLTEQGTYRDTVLAENNIYTVVVTVNPTYYFPENRTVNQGSLPFNWHGKTFNASTTAYDSLTTTAGCDSVYFLTLTVTPFNIIEDTPIALCQGETANWRGKMLSEAGTYRDTALAENTIHTVVVTVNPTYYFPENHTVTQGSLPFNWHGKTFNTSATAYDSLTTTAGCDSVYFLTLTVTPFNIVQDGPIALCQGETANWRGHLVAEQGTYRDTVLAENTIYTVVVTVNPTYYFPENRTVNQGSLPFNWHGKTFNASATAYDSLTTTAGCDSVYFLTLTVTPFNIIEDTPIALCQGETANWRGHLLSEQGTYRDTVPAENTIHTVVVTVNPTYYFPENRTVNQGSLPFNWHGKTFNASATAYDSLTTTAGCDSVYFLNLTVTAFNIIEDNPIALCQGETANWRGHLLTEQGTYRDTVLTENTIHTVEVTVNPTYFFSENHTVTQGSLPFNWHGKTFNASATAYDSLTTTAGCDSVFFLTLTVTAFNIVQDGPIALCQGETANWRGHLVAEQGTYSDTALAENNIYTVDVTVNPTYYFPENITVNQGSLPFNWHGKTFNASATAYDSLTTTVGCDSVFFLTFTVTPFNIVQDDPIALCQGETANWRGHLVAEQGTYSDTALAENNIYTVDVTVNPTYYFPENITVTQGSLPFNWHGKTFNASATAYDSLTTTAGCDSVYFLTLTVTAFNIIEDDPIALCQGETANWRGHLLTEQGTYRDTVLAENTIYTVVVTVNPTYFFPENVTVTQGSLPFNWHGKTFNASATAYDSLTTTAGCDSVYFLTLTVTAFNIVQDDPIALCQGETANWRGHLLTEQGTYRDTVLAENTIYTVVVTVNPTYYFPENITVTQGSLPFNWHGKTFNASTTAYDSLTTTAGCDSVYFLTLTVTAFNIVQDNPIALCQGETANWRGKMLAEQGTYRDTVLAENNIYTVDVTVNPTYYFPENITVTQGSLPFNWHGKTFNASTTAYDSLTTTAGCDSVFFLTLTVTAFNIVQDNPIALCQGETANWRGHLLTEQGAYRDTVLAENTIYTVDVTVNPTYYFPENITVTQGSLPYNWHGKTFNASTTAYDSLTTTVGCDSVYFLTLTVTPFNIIEDTPIALCQGETANWRGKVLTEQGTYSDTALAENNIYTVVVTVNPTYAVDTAVTITSNDLPYHFVSGQIDTTFEIGTAQLSTFNFQLSTQYGCDSTVTLTLTINVGIEDYEKEGGLTVHPNPTTGVLNINGHDPFTQIQVLDAFGRIIRNYPAEGTQTIIDLNGLAPGVYIIRATNSNRVVGLKKIVKVNL